MISGLATNAALTTVENKIPNINDLVKKTDYDVKFTDHNHDKYITVPKFNTFNAFNVRLAQVSLKTDF